MPSFNLTKAADRRRFRQDHADELQAIEAGNWPRDTADAVRWSTQDAAKVAKACRDCIAYVDDLERRIAVGEVEGFEARPRSYDRVLKPG